MMRRACLFIGMVSSVAIASAQDDLSFNRDIRPILSDNCFACHGPDAKHRQADLRLDIREDAIAAGAFVPGEPDKSALVERIHHADPKLAMPPAESPKKLSAAQKETLKRWIAAGAPYEGHWAYQPPKKPEIPAGANAIDHLVGQRLKKLGLQPSPEADRRTLARRLRADLIGLPPTAEEVDALVADPAPDAIDKYVETLLANPHYGERMAIGWLDVVRFADTIGYHSDNPRNVYPYRDWVIRSFNTNLPFDRFTIEQLAGDLLPDSGVDQKIASAFNRLLLTTEEGGAQAKDYEARYMTDRVRALGTVWLGQTIGCCQCHDHKFDPLTARDFYSAGAFFADIQEAIIGGREPGMPAPNDTEAAELSKLKGAADALDARFNAPHPELNDAFVAWQVQTLDAIKNDRQWMPLQPTRFESQGKAEFTVLPDHALLVRGESPATDTTTLEFIPGATELLGLRLEVFPDPSLPGQGPGRAGNGNFVVSEVLAQAIGADGTVRDLKFSAARASHEQSDGDPKNPYKSWPAAATIDGDAQGANWGWAVLPNVGKRNELQLTFADSVVLKGDEKLSVVIRQNLGDRHTLGKFRVSSTTSSESLTAPLGIIVPPEIAALLDVPSDQRTPAHSDQLSTYFKNVAPELAELRGQREAARKAAVDFENNLPKVLVSISMPTPRVVRILPRGNWQDESVPEMKPAIPAFLAGGATPPEDRRLTRLDLAKWVVARENPLTARVFVNRLWKQFFGVGISKSVDDFGAQGEPPVNPELLDWLAVEFMDSGWDVKHMVRLIVNSKTYRQTSVASKEALARDPENREIARQSRFRMDAELVRDNALAVSGLLVDKIGGPSVKPYQPAGYWENLNFPVREWQADTNENQWRRGMYTWWQRSFVHPSMLAFDSPTREECAADRPRSNIPQQALVLLNDPTYVEAARALGAKIIRAGGDPASRITFAFRQALVRQPDEAERAQLLALVETLTAKYTADRAAAAATLKVGLAPAPADVDAVELAVWTNVARVLLNLHESIVRE